jgi:hypothetical protein
VCDPVIVEVLAGARDEAHLQSLRGLLGRAIALRTDHAVLHADADFDTLAELTALRIHPL